MSTMLTTPEQIDAARLITLRGALKLELLGMKRRGRSAYAIIKDEFGLKGNKQSVYNQFDEIVNDITGANDNV